ncbi:MAG: sulfite exporter TauE/SafE family protein [Firmicutes bacterium]|jgi:hypothetical protein|nr:sulfite exporter TauE/SafE family protein [Bacillota bacterium]
MVHVTAIQQVLAVISGLIVGFSLGLIGGGGSILAVPLLLYLVGIRDPHLVIGTTALAVAVNAYLNLIPHWRSGNVQWTPAIAFAIPGAIGAFVGSSIGKIVNGKDLLFLFAILMLVVALLMLRPKKSESGMHFHWHSKMFWQVIPAGFLVGAVSGFFGIGGGFLIVPGLIMSTGMPMIYAIGTSLFSVGTFGLTTAINYAMSGLVLWLVVVEYILGGVAGGVLGTRLANQLSKHKRTLNFVFSGVVIIVGIYMLTLNA